MLHIDRRRSGQLFLSGNGNFCGNPEVASYLGNGRLQVGTARLVVANISGH